LPTIRWLQVAAALGTYPHVSAGLHSKEDYEVNYSNAPQHLNERQQSTISNFLWQFESHEDSFRRSARSEEAGSDRADI
jgi:hypothetical protein